VRNIAKLFILLAALAPMAVFAQGQRIAFVNVSYLVDNSPQAEAASAQLQEKFGSQQQELQRKQEEFQELRQKLEKDSLVMSESEREQGQERLQQLGRELQRGQKSFRDALNNERNAALQQVREVVMTTVQDIAQEEGYDLVVGQGAVYASESVNITEQVLEQMKARFESQSE
jgi:outer membrane protein